MGRLVVDCSVAVKWFVPEDNSGLALRLLRGKDELHAPTSLIPEFTNVMWKLVRRRLLPGQDALRMVSEVGAIDLLLHPVDELTAPALAMALAAGHPAYDCFYLALALHLEARCVTADRRFYHAFAERYPDTLTWIEDLALSPEPSGSD